MSDDLNDLDARLAAYAADLEGDTAGSSGAVNWAGGEPAAAVRAGDAVGDAVPDPTVGPALELVTIEAAAAPVTAPARNGRLLSLAAAAIVVVVVGLGVAWFSGRDNGDVDTASASTDTEAVNAADPGCEGLDDPANQVESETDDSAPDRDACNVRGGAAPDPTSTTLAPSTMIDAAPVTVEATNPGPATSLPTTSVPEPVENPEPVPGPEPEPDPNPPSSSADTVATSTPTTDSAPTPVPDPAPPIAPAAVPCDIVVRSGVDAPWRWEAVSATNEHLVHTGPSSVWDVGSQYEADGLAFVGGDPVTPSLEFTRTIAELVVDTATSPNCHLQQSARVDDETVVVRACRFDRDGSDSQWHCELLRIDFARSSAVVFSTTLEPFHDVVDGVAVVGYRDIVGIDIASGEQLWSTPTPDGTPAWQYIHDYPISDVPSSPCDVEATAATIEFCESLGAQSWVFELDARTGQEVSRREVVRTDTPLTPISEDVGRIDETLTFVVNGQRYRLVPDEANSPVGDPPESWTEPPYYDSTSIFEVNTDGSQGELVATIQTGAPIGQCTLCHVLFTDVGDGWLYYDHYFGTSRVQFPFEGP